MTALAVGSTHAKENRSPIALRRPGRPAVEQLEGHGFGREAGRVVGLRDGRVRRPQVEAPGDRDDRVAPGLGLDLAGVAWDLNRDWPGRRLPLPPEPKRGGKLKPEPLTDGQPWPPGTVFV